MSTTPKNESAPPGLSQFGDGVGWKWLLALYLGLAVLTGAVSFFSRPFKIERSADLQRQVWTGFQTPGGAADPRADIVYRVNSTRILMPASMAGVVHLTGRGWPEAFSLVRLFTIALTYLVFHWYLRGWFPDLLALLGTLFMAATIPLTFNSFFEIPTDFPEVLTYTLGLWCIRERRHWLLCLVIAVGTLSRETTVFLPLILLLTLLDWKSLWSSMWRAIPKVAAAGFSWLLPWMALRWWVGVGGQWHGVYGDSIAHNFPGLMRFFENFNPYNNYLFYLYLFGVFWFLPFARWRRQPPFLRRALLSLPAFLVVYTFLGGFLDEPREIVNLYPLLVPAGLFALFGRERHAEVEHAG